MIGLGGGGIPAFLCEHFPSLTVHCIEIDGAVAEAALLWFGLRKWQDSGQLVVHVQDASTLCHHWSSTASLAFDVVLLDVFSQGLFPAKLATKEFFMSLKGLMTPSGSLAVNFGDLLAGQCLLLCETIQDTIGTPVIAHGADQEEDAGNLVAFAGYWHPGMVGSGVASRTRSSVSTMAQTWERFAAHYKTTFQRQWPYRLNQVSLALAHEDTRCTSLGLDALTSQCGTIAMCVEWGETIA